MINEKNMINETNIINIAKASLKNEFDNSIEIPKDEYLSSIDYPVYSTIYNSNNMIMGCMGNIFDKKMSVYDGIILSTKLAAFRDIRYCKLLEKNTDKVKIVINIITHIKEYYGINESDLVNIIYPPYHGVIFEYMSYKSLFLPMVWEEYDHLYQFMGCLKLKAGLKSIYFWRPEIKISTILTTVFDERIKIYRGKINGVV